MCFSITEVKQGFIFLANFDYQRLRGEKEGNGELTGFENFVQHMSMSWFEKAVVPRGANFHAIFLRQMSH